MNLIPDDVMQTLAGHDSPINLQELVYILTRPDPQALFIKNRNLEYVYASPFFTDLMGLKNGQKIRGMRDTELCANKSLTDRYEACDLEVLEQGMPIDLCDTINPKHNESFLNTMEGKEYPLYGKHDRPEFLLGIVSPKMKIIKLDWNTLFSLDDNEIASLLSKKFYLLDDIRFSRREIQVLIAMMKGQHAGEIAFSMQLKQSTVESYFVNIKNKIGVNTKSEIIHFMTDKNPLEKIIL